ncbi:MAG: HEAT repeat domain-containing protein [Planctomycetota bacterium]|jgi:HEAT repeat protein
MVRSPLLPPLLLPGFALLVLLATPAHSGEVKNKKEWKALYKECKGDLYGLATSKRKDAIRRIGAANWPDAAKTLVDFVKKPNARLIPLERRRPVVLKEIQKYHKRARAQGNKLALEDIKTLRNLEDEFRKINKTIAAETKLKRFAVELLGGFTHPEAVDWILEEALSNRSWRVRLGLLEALAFLNDERAVETLKEALVEEDPGIRSRALESLVERGAEARFQACLDGLQDEFWQVRAVAICALGRFGEIKAVEALIEALNRETGRMRGDIAEALRMLTGKTLDADYQLWKAWWASDEHKKEAEAFCAIRKGLSSEEPEVRAKALVDLARQGPELGYPAALRAFRSKDKTMREAALDAFGILRDLRVVPILIKALWEDDEEFCKRVEQCLIVLTGCTEDHEADPDNWKKWWKKNRKKVRESAPAPAPGPEGKGKPVQTGTTFYGIPTHSTNVMFILDVSGSMSVPIHLPEGVPLAPKGCKDQPGVGPRAATRLGLAQWEMKKAIGGLSEKSRFNIIYYSVDAHVFSKSKMCLATKSKKKAAYAFVDHLVADGGTNIAGGLELAFTLENPKDEKKNLKTGIDTIYFLSDGMPSVGKIQDPDRILDWVEERNRIRKIVIHSICLVSKRRGAGPQQEDPEKMKDFMRRLAEDNGGRFVKH